jgi:hypothetical protein
MQASTLSLAKHFWVQHIVCAGTLALCFFGCKKSEAPANTTPQPAVPAASATQPAAPTGPVPTYSAAEKVGLYAYPGKGQSHDQQLIDESDCYNSAQQQTGVNPEMGAPQAPSSAEVQAAQA